VRTWRLVLEYDGGGYCGWQRQPDVLSIQEHVEDAVAHVLGVDTRVAVIASGRTDAGVHALGQVCSFRTNIERRPINLLEGMNSHLPEDIAVLEAAQAHVDFHAQRSAIGKLYRYVIRQGPGRSALRRGRHWGVRWPLHIDDMRAGLAHVVGTHDFTSFRAAGCSANSPVRRVDRAEIRVVDDEIWFEIYGGGFLRHMVRNLVGSVLEVGRGRREPAWIGELLALRDRREGGRTVPGCGLFLVRVDYPPTSLVP
jgi:tRNA pseudouridine38-40 synthase